MYGASRRVLRHNLPTVTDRDYLTYLGMQYASPITNENNIITKTTVAMYDMMVVLISDRRCDPVLYGRGKYTRYESCIQLDTAAVSRYTSTSTSIQQ